MKTRSLILMAALLGAACSETTDPPVADLARTDAGRDLPDLTTPDRQQGPDAAPAVPFTPSDLTLGQMACVAAGLSTGSSAASEASRQVNLARLKAAGIRLMRIDFLWHRIEKTKGTFDFSGHDLRVKAAQSANIDHIAVLAYGNPWATTLTEDDPYFPPDDPADFAPYVTAMVEHYAGSISDFEIWNEPNAGYRFWKSEPGGDPAAFAALLDVAVTAGRAACPTCRFAFGAPFFHEMLIMGHLEFLELAHVAVPGLDYDAMGFHPYPLYPPQAAPEGPPPGSELSFHDMAAGIEAVMEAAGTGGRPLWTTEVGWPVYGSVTAVRQADFLVRAALHLIALNANPVCWYNLYEGPDPGSFPPEQAFGLLTSDDEPKPAFFAMAQLAGRFAGHRPTRDLRVAGLLPPGVWGYELSDGEATWWAVWTHPEPGPLEVTLPSTPVEGHDAVGEAIELPAVPTWGATGSPVFLRL